MFCYFDEISDIKTTNSKIRVLATACDWVDLYPPTYDEKPVDGLVLALTKNMNNEERTGILWRALSTKLALLIYGQLIVCPDAPQPAITEFVNGDFEMAHKTLTGLPNEELLVFNMTNGQWMPMPYHMPPDYVIDFVPVIKKEHELA